jgi:hypothetical protein
MLVVLSIYHCKNGRDYSFVHGVFPCPKEAKRIADEVRLNPAYILEEGYEYNELEDRGISVSIVSVPMGIRVNEYVSMDF